MDIVPFIDSEWLHGEKKYFRINSLKIHLNDFAGFSNLEYISTPIPEVKEYIGNQKLGNSLEYFLGFIHPQSLSSAYVARVLRPRPGETVLDMCAAPGSKATHLAALMKNKGVLMANDLKRSVALISNISRLGVINALVSKYDASKIPGKEVFDKILLDPPCTSLSKPHAWKRFTPEMARRYGEIQKKMILRAYDLLKPGGHLVYSTCTYTPEENEAVVIHLLENREARLLNVDIPGKRPGLSEFGLEARKMARLYPKFIKSEGFFIAHLQKK